MNPTIPKTMQAVLIEDFGSASRALGFAGKRVESFFLANWMGKQNFLQVLMNLWRVRRGASHELQSAVQKRFPLAAVNQAVGLYQRNPTAGKVLLIAAAGGVLGSVRTLGTSIPVAGLGRTPATVVD